MTQPRVLTAHLSSDNRAPKGGTPSRGDTANSQGRQSMNNKRTTHHSRLPRRTRDWLKLIQPGGMLLVAALLLLPKEARAGQVCSFDRAVVLLSTALPEELKCTYDQDGNGLDDDMELELAKCMAPLLKFDALEPPESRLSGEPQVLFSMQLVNSQPVPGMNARVKIQYQFLYTRDGGFVDWHFPCGKDAHDGDNHSMDLLVDVYPGSHRWQAELESVDGHPPDEVSGTHVVSYVSAGKHHMSPQPYAGWDTCKGGAGAQHYDSSLGDGAWIQPTVLHHVPLFDPEPQPLGQVMHGATAPLAADGKTWLNACDAARFPSNSALWRVATKLHPNSLDDLGYGGERIAANRKFCGGLEGPCSETSFVWPKHNWSGDADVDGDGLPEMSAYIVRDGNVTAIEAQDPCPNLQQGAWVDADGDGIHDACDPDPQFKSTFVAGGSANYPTAPPLLGSGSHPWTRYEQWWAYGFPRGGFLDSDQDGSPDGEDMCPTVPGGSPVLNANRWGEDRNWSPVASWHHDMGKLLRSDVCDPYPVPAIEWKAKYTGPNKCASAGWYLSGSGPALKGRTAVWRGVSENGAALNAPAQPTQMYRCACRTSTGGDVLSTQACYLQSDSDCYKVNVTVADPTVYDGHGYRPVFREGGTLDANTWTQPVQLSVPVFDWINSDWTWNWQTERAQYPESSQVKHFAPGDFIDVPAGQWTEAYTKAAYDYVSMSLVDIPYAPGNPQQSGAFFPDPEYQTEGQALLNLNGPQSKRMRFGVSKDQVRLSTIHSQWYPGVQCEDPSSLTLGQWLEKYCLFGCGPDPDPASVHWWIVQPRALLQNGRAFANRFLARPLSKNLAGLTLGRASSRSWVASARGLMAMTAVQAAITPEEPDLLFVETDATPTRWAKLRASGVTATNVEYEILEEGIVDSTMSASAQIVADSMGRTAAIFDGANGTLVTLDAETGLWQSVTPPAAVARRAGAALSVVGSAFYVLGGEYERQLQSDGWAIDLFGAGSSQVVTGLPLRRDARVGVRPNGQTLLLYGGTDERGRRHDDIWKINLGSSTGRASQLWSDTSEASRFDPATTTLEVPAFGDDAIKWVVTDSAPEKLVGHERGSNGWNPVGR